MLSMMSFSDDIRVLLEWHLDTTTPTWQLAPAHHTQHMLYTTPAYYA